MIVMTVEPNRTPHRTDMTLGELGSFGIGMSKEEALKHFDAAELDRKRMEAAIVAFPSDATVVGDVTGMVNAFTENWNKVKGFYAYGPRAFGGWAKGADDSGAWFRAQTKKIFDAVRKRGGSIPPELSEGFDETKIKIGGPGPDEAFPVWGTVAIAAGAIAILYMGWRYYRRRGDF